MARSLCRFDKPTHNHTRRGASSGFFMPTHTETTEETLYDVFHRTWWRNNHDWPNGLEPHAGRKTYIERGVTWTEARRLCKEYNDENDPGRLSDKAEFEEQ